MTLEETLIDMANDQALCMSYNGHHCSYQTAAEAYSRTGPLEGWVSQASRKEALDNDRVWIAGGKMAARLAELIPHPDATRLDDLIRSHCTGEFSEAYLELNEYKSSNESVEDFIESDDWVDEEHKLRSLIHRNVWYYRCYPNTPNGFYHQYASTLDAVLQL